MIGGYTAYLEEKDKNSNKDKKEAAKAYQEDKQKQRASIPSMTTKEKQELEMMETTIAQLEGHIANLDQEMHEANDDYVKVRELAKQHETQSQVLEEKMERWIFLQEKKQEIEDYKNKR